MTDGPMLDQSSELTDAGGSVLDDYSGAGSPHLDDMVGLEEMMGNITNDKEMACYFNFLRSPYPPEPPLPGAGPDAVYCNSTWDGISCWPTTLAGSTSVLPCIAELYGVRYDTRRKSLYSF